jgi:hypothetical protein
MMIQKSGMTMTDHQLLDNVAHKDLRVITQFSPVYGDDASYTNIVLAELLAVQAYYPIFFRKNTETGQFETVALFGFDQQENLFLSVSGWDANYIPLTIQRRPFLIGFQEQNINGVVEREPVVHIDMDSPRVSQTDGEAVFLPQGGQSEYLQQISSVLKTIHDGHQQTKHFVDELLQHDLIESLTIKVELNSGEKHELAGLYTIHEEKVAQLNSETLSALHQKGYLKFIHLIAASHSHINDLIERKNQQE